MYLARDTALNREVAIKILPTAFSGDPDRLRCFMQEAQAAAALNHRNILAVFQLGTYEGAPYLVSELLEGETLLTHLRTPFLDRDGHIYGKPTLRPTQFSGILKRFLWTVIRA